MIVLAASLVLLGVIAHAVDRFVETAGESRAARLTRQLLWAFATVVVVEAGLGALGWLTPGATLLTLAALAGRAMVTLRRRPRVEPVARERLSPVVVGLLAALVAVFALRAWAGLHRTSFLYDTLSYHLHIPATWMHDRRISIVPAVFGDPSSAYAPANVELWFLFLMAPLRSDYLAGIGQLPFAVLAATAIAATVRDGAGSRGAALGAALVFLLIPEVWGQLVTAMTDLGFAACLLASLPFLIRLWDDRQPRRQDLLTVAAAIGLASGTKHAAATVALPFAALAGAAWLRKRPFDLRGPALALVVMVATGGFWYLRNAVVTGNPLYPVAVPGLSLPALYGGAQMRAWEYHLPVTDLGALGAILIDAGIGFCVAFAVAFADSGRRALLRRASFDRDSPTYARLWFGISAGLLVASTSIFWFVIPYQESRFLFVAFGVAAAVIGRAAQATLVGTCALVVAIGAGLIQHAARDSLPSLAVGAVAAVAWARWGRPLSDLGTRARRLLAGATAAALVIAVAVGANRYARRDPGYGVGDETDEAWSWFRANVRDTPVAYTGTNLAFPLAGERLANDVRYVNVAGRAGDRLHDFGPPGDGTAEPAPYRRGADPDVWLANLRAARTRVLYVAALYPIVRRTIDADGDGFPIERAWADARPAVFHLRYASVAARVYDVELP
ncbi:MAG TPA: hypothetical protein VKQ32_29540 [Polyangia bacterium]|nr:hypothetical protein [Polyangia bacterium]